MSTYAGIGSKTQGIGSGAPSKNDPTPTGTPPVNFMEAYHSKIWFEGWLIKEGGKVRSWKRRYFTLKGGKIHYYKSASKSEADLKGAIEFKFCDTRYVGLRYDIDEGQSKALVDPNTATSNTATQANEKTELDSVSSEEDESDLVSEMTRGSMALTSSTSGAPKKQRAATDVSRYRYKFCLEGGDRTLYMAAQSMESVKEWMQALKNCIHVENYFQYCKNFQCDNPSLPAIRAFHDHTCKALVIENERVSIGGLKAVCEILKTNKTITKLVIKDASLSDKSMEVIASMLGHNEVIRHVDLSSNRIADEGVCDLVDGLYINHQLTYLSLANNCIGDVGAIHISDVLCGNTSLSKLDISSNRIGGKGAESLAKAMESNALLKELELGSNQLGDAGAAALAEGLKHNKTLERLGLSNNLIGSQGLVTLCAEGITNNRSLKDLELAGNEFDKQGAVALVAAVKDHKTLTRIDLGNNKKLGIQGLVSLADILKQSFTLNKLVMTRPAKK